MKSTILPVFAVLALVGGCERPVNDVESTPPVPENRGTMPRTPGANNNTNNPNPVTTPPVDRVPETGTNPTAPAAVGSPDAQALSILLLKDTEEAAIGRLAQQKAVSDAARQLADALVNDHTQHAQRVQDVVRSENLRLLEQQQAKQAFARMSGQQATQADPLAQLQSLSGEEFDRRFGEMMAQGHRELIRVLNDAKAGLTNASVQTLVNETIPVLQHHEELAQAIGRSSTSP